MRHREIRELMTREVVTVPRQRPVQADCPNPDGPQAARRAASPRPRRGVVVPRAVPVPTTDVRRQWSQALLTEAAEALRTTQPRLDVVIRSLDGRPAAMLAHVAANAGLIVLGSRGLGTLMGFVLGSVGMAVIQATVRPVVVVRASERARTPYRTPQADTHPVTWWWASTPASPAMRYWPSRSRRRRGGAYDPRIHAQLEMSAKAALEDVLGPWQAEYPAVAPSPRGRASGTPPRSSSTAAPKRDSWSSAAAFGSPRSARTSDLSPTRSSTMPRDPSPSSRTNSPPT